MTREEIWSNIAKLSELRSQYSCFDEKEEPFYHALSLGIKALEKESKTGQWEICQDDDGMYGICNICGQDSDFTHYGEVYKYCPNCGAKMESEVEE